MYFAIYLAAAFHPALTADCPKNGSSYLNVPNFENSVSGTCFYCPLNCFTCPNRVCTRCVTGYFLSGSTCRLCPPNCQQCTSTSCVLCAGGFYLSQTKSTEMLTIQSCVACGNGVASCPNNFPSSCQPGFFLTGSQCVFCTNSLCLSCNSVTTCGTCLTGYYVSTDGTCQSCPNNCYNCTGIVTCALCLPGFILANGVCANACSSGVYSNSAGSCLACDSNCLICVLRSGVPTCNTCMTGFFLNNNACIPGGSVLCSFSIGFGLGMCSTNSCSLNSYPAGQSVLLFPIPKTSVSYCLPSLFYNRNPQYMLSSKILAPADAANLIVCNYYLFYYASTAGVLTLSNYYSIVPSFSLSFTMQIFLAGVTNNNPTVTVGLLNSPAGQPVQTVTLPLSLTKFQADDCRTPGSKIAIVTVQFSTLLLNWMGNHIQITPPTGATDIGLGEVLITASPCQQQGCLRCASAFNCLSCGAPYFLSLQNCVTTCPLGFFSNAADQTCYVNCPTGTYGSIINSQCMVCRSGCLSCSSPSACQSCSAGFFLLESRCVSSCQDATTPKNLFIFSNTQSQSCSPCVTPCNSCSDTSGTNCLSCSIGYLSGTTCVSRCPSGTFGTISTAGGAVNPVCQSCDVSCSSCIVTSTTCLSCSGSTFLSNNACIASCQGGTYGTGNSCLVCSPPCSTCTSTATTCTSCIFGYLSSGQCLNICPSNSYSSGGQCVSCTNNCRTCTSAVLCSTCVDGFFLSNSACSTTCPSGTYKNTATNSCSSCTPPCATCSSTNGATCLTCLLGYLVAATNSCVTFCPVGFYGSTSKVCTACDSGCLICTYITAVVCTKCDGNNGKFLQSGSCVLDCPDGKYSYVDTITGQGLCLACTSPCATCSQAPFFCLTCVAAAPFLLNNLCYATAPAGYFVSGSDLLPCNSNCLTCTGTATTCVTCPLITYLTSDKTCVATCSPNSLVGINGQCVTCASQILNCATCKLGYCLTCSTGFNIYQGTCFANCPSGTMAVDQACQPCVGCLACSTSVTTCTKCSNTQYLNLATNLCITNCSTGFYGQISTGTCQACSPTCATCGTSATQCLTCPTGTLAEGFLCVTACSSGFFASGSSCRPCSSSCLTCRTSATTCSSCSIGSFLDGSTCSSTCSSSTTYPDKITSTCLACVNPCRTCSTINRCLSCNYWFLYNSGCVATCPLGYFAVTASNTCSSCSSNCVGCSGTATNCNICAVGLTLLTSGGSTSCVSACPNGQYIAKTVNGTGYCSLCSTNCRTCRSFSFCLSCPPSNLLSEGSCVSVCSANSVSVNGECRSCSSGCQACSESQCLKCISGYLKDGQCISSCPQSFFGNPRNMECTKCLSPCNTCTDTYFCLTCVEGYYKYQRVCVLPPCPNSGWFNFDLKQCEASCPRIKYQDTANMICYTTCPPKLFATVNINTGQKLCVRACPPGFFVNNSITCEPCTPQQCNSLFTFSITPLYASPGFALLLRFSKAYNLTSNITNSTFAITFPPAQYYTVNDGMTTAATSRMLSVESYSAQTLKNRAIILSFNGTSVQSSDLTVDFYQRYATLILAKDGLNPLQNYRASAGVVSWYNYQKSTVGGVSLFFVIAILIVSVLCLAINRFPIIQFTVEAGQILFLASLLQIQYPQHLQIFLSSFSGLHLLFLPQFSVPQDLLLNAPGKYVSQFIDVLFLRHCGHAYFVLIIFWLVVLLSWVINKFLQAFLSEYPRVLKGAETVLNRLSINGVFEVTWFVYYTLGFLSIAQYKDPQTGTGFLNFNILFTALNTAAVFGFTVWALYFNFVCLKYELDLKDVAHLYPFLLKDVSTNPIGLMNCSFNYVRKFIICILIGGLSELSTSFFAITILFSLLTLLPMIRYLPFNNQTQDYIRIAQELGLVLLLTLMLFMSLARQALTITQLASFGWAVIVFAIILLTLSLLWAVYLLVFEMREIYRQHFALSVQVAPETPALDSAKPLDDKVIVEAREEEDPKQESGSDIERQSKEEESGQVGKTVPKMHNRNDFIHYQPSDMSEDEDGEEPPLVLIKCLKNTSPVNPAGERKSEDDDPDQEVAQFD